MRAEDARMVIKRVSPMSAAKLQGIIGVVMGLLIGGMFSLFALVVGGIAAASDQGAAGALGGMLFGVGAVIMFPIFYGGVSFVAGAIGAFVYNLAAGWVGGLEIEAQ
jgi:hypothetical protein